MDNKIIDRLEDIINRMIQAFKIFSAAADDFIVINSNEEFMDNLESYEEDVNILESSINMLNYINKIVATIDNIQWYLSQQNGESISFDGFKALALDSPKKGVDSVYQINLYELESDSSFKFNDSIIGISKSFDEAQRTIWRSGSSVERLFDEHGAFYEIIERSLNEIGHEKLMYWLFNEYGQMLDYAYSDDVYHLFRGFETVRFESGEIVLFINKQHHSLEPCIIVEPPYTITECWELNNRLRDKCFENEEAYTKAIYEQKIEGKDCYKVYTLKGEKLIDCLPVYLIRASNFGDRSSMPIISSEDYRSLMGWYDDYISKNQKYDF